MSLAIKSVDDFLTDQVDNGSCSSIKDVEQEMLVLLTKRSIESGISQGREDVKNGLYREVTVESNAKFIDDLAKKILPKASV